MIKDIVIGVCITGLAAAGVFTKRGIDSTYLRVEKLEQHADIIYVRQDVYQQAQNQNRIWQLEDRIQAIKSNAARQGRDLTSAEKEQIRQMQRDIQRLK